MVAEVDDDLPSLSIPVEAQTTSQTTSPQEETRAGVDASQSSQSQAEAPPSSKVADSLSSSALSQSHQVPEGTPSKPSKQTYPLYPSITQLLHEKGIPSFEVTKIPASGPKGRLLKGDVLAYLGAISKSYSSDQSSRISKLSHLDLSNVKVTPPAEASQTPASKTGPEVPPSFEPEPDTEVAVTVSLTSVLEVQKRIQETLHITLPLSTFITRATEIANDNLPQSKTARPTTDELFNQVLGLDKVASKTPRGSFIPQITALPATSGLSRASFQRPAPQPDIIDSLTGQSFAVRKMHLPKPLPGVLARSSPGASTNVFSVSVPQSEEKRAKVFLERIKTILQVE